LAKADISLTDIFSITYHQKNTTLEMDALILSCCAYRLINQFMGLEDDRLPGLVIEQDYELANTIKKHYSQRLMFTKLQGSSFTQFKSDLSNLIHTSYDTDGSGKYIYPDRMLGMAYKLPYFYFYDLEISDLFGSEIVSLNGTEDEKTRALKKLKTLNYIKKTKTHRARDYTIEYWFNDELNNKVKLNIDEKNPLRNLFENLLKEPITIDGIFTPNTKIV
jgi:hypothetical protein